LKVVQQKLQLLSTVVDLSCRQCLRNLSIDGSRKQRMVRCSWTLSSSSAQFQNNLTIQLSNRDSTIALEGPVFGRKPETKAGKVFMDVVIKLSFISKYNFQTTIKQSRLKNLSLDGSRKQKLAKCLWTLSSSSASFQNRSAPPWKFYYQSTAPTDIC